MCIPIVYSSGVSDYVASVLFCWECPLLINSLDSLIMAHIQMMYIQIPIVSMNLGRVYWGFCYWVFLDEYVQSYPFPL